ncbi:hypothetical protein TVAG_167650 [Trichomonas vaginalis G3]|uniref:Uncharacterized protein n=1 Tax=Trichomonas vaginalis (strain ATCC PRA-98 / G3) TaxID=412133 RepID=A2G2J4_TRIV3|nr:hypothetical protein TVAGG3_0918850 [Trichomonas vaginalis G3]EAX88618.1 hypothetical protein TVAG_167650 [Trichomonas vaginalis G3]KAI5485003.1 hypothetical protein TVAGG3_0918850 [Trichomonas vaginalis G3]|eukprot:XP_001301548.1 hypothetical protein [Trichomonas vaginalis G3]
MKSKINGITDDISKIPFEDQRFYALNAFPKMIKIGKFDLNEKFIQDFLNNIDLKADKTYVDNELEKKADKTWVELKIKRTTKIPCLYVYEFLTQRISYVREIVGYYKNKVPAPVSFPSGIKLKGKDLESQIKSMKERIKTLETKVDELNQTLSKVLEKI